jgi:hypothetical protein
MVDDTLEFELQCLQLHASSSKLDYDDSMNADVRHHAPRALICV